MIGTRHRSPGFASRLAALRQSILGPIAALTKPASVRALKAAERTPVEIQCRPQPPLCKAREMRIAIERPRIPWHEHPAWTEYALTRKDSTRMSPGVITASDIHAMMLRAGKPATEIIR